MHGWWDGVKVTILLLAMIMYQLNQMHANGSWRVRMCDTHYHTDHHGPATCNARGLRPSVSQGLQTSPHDMDASQSFDFRKQLSKALAKGRMLRMKQTQLHSVLDRLQRLHFRRLSSEDTPGDTTEVEQETVDQGQSGSEQIAAQAEITDIEREGSSGRGSGEDDTDGGESEDSMGIESGYLALFNNGCGDDDIM